MEKIWKELTHKTRKFVWGTGYKKVVLGVSGGIDSAVTAAIACDALGSQNVLGVMLPSPYSSLGSVTDAQQLAANWGFGIVKIPIMTLMTGVDVSLEPLLGYNEPRAVTQENIQARIRMVLLMAICNEQDRLLLNTCNKSEDYVGYATLYGDSCGAIAPLGGLYKTEVYALAHWVNLHPDLPHIPEASLTKAPSAELSPGQKDDDDIPPYDVIDPILQIFVDKKGTIQDAVNAGYDTPTAARIWKLMRGSAFKRRQSAPVIEITGAYR